MLPDKIRSRDDENQVGEHSHLLTLRRAVRKTKIEEIWGGGELIRRDLISLVVTLRYLMVSMRYMFQRIGKGKREIPKTMVNSQLSQTKPHDLQNKYHNCKKVVPHSYSPYGPGSSIKQ